ncbi:hypothetical protein E4U32_000358 [Claviceps aff. humidiphila group G2b]|nr:hypothetical protein E4U32_000358 [Claviceps aff. humidiphila group G2b]
MSTCISDDQLYESRLTRVERQLDTLSKKVEDISPKLCNEYMKQCVETEEQLETKSTEAKDLRSELHSLKKQLQQEKADRQDKVEQLETKSTEAKDLRSELLSLKKQLQQEKADRQDKVEQLETKSTEAKGLRSELQFLKKQLQQQKADSQEKVAGLTMTIQGLDEDKRKLREVILGNALRHEVSDDEIRQRFVNIRQQIQAVVNSPAYDKTRDFTSDDAEDDFDISWYQEYNSYSLRDRVFVMRSAIYEIIRHYILSGDAFGLAAAGCVSPLECNQEAELDQSLCDFEDLLRTRKGAVV